MHFCKGWEAIEFPITASMWHLLFYALQCEKVAKFKEIQGTCRLLNCPSAVEIDGKKIPYEKLLRGIGFKWRPTAKIELLNQLLNVALAVRVCYLFDLRYHCTFEAGRELVEQLAMVGIRYHI